MARAFLVVLDSVGIGGAPDAGAYFNGDLPDAGANTLGHIAEARDLHLPHMAALGLGQALHLASGLEAPALSAPLAGRWAVATEVSNGKDTPSGHWELAGVPVPWDWRHFPSQGPAFDAELVQAVCEAAGTDGILGNCHAPGTRIINDLGPEHLRTGWPICYTSADSVFQIAAHEEAFGLQNLLDLCATLAPRLHAMKVGRVIARPFAGSGSEGFTRTLNRRDYALSPPAPTLCDWVQDAGGQALGIGKIGDIFSMQGIDRVQKGADRELANHLANAVEEAPEASLTFANFVEFDSLYGHPRDVAGYAAHLEWFDTVLGRILPRLRAGDMLVITADHGNDPTWPGTDHTRERVPVLIAGRGVGSAGHVGFADVAASVADHLGVASQGPGRSFLTD